MSIEQEIKIFLSDSGADVCGITSVKRFKNAPTGYHPCDLYPKCRSVIVFGTAIPRALLRIDPRIVYLKAMSECLAELDRLSFLSGVWLERRGAEAVSLPSDDPCGYWDAETSTGKGLLSMKHAAELAGLGRIGKNALLNNRLFGNRLMIGCVLTNLILESDPMAEDICPPDCRICLDNCPQHALDGRTLNQQLCREIIYTKNERGVTVNNCNRCRSLCPQALRRPRVRERVVPS